MKNLKNGVMRFWPDARDILCATVLQLQVVRYYYVTCIISASNSVHEENKHGYGLIQDFTG